MPSLSSKITDPQNRSTFLAISFAAVATGVAMYVMHKLINSFDLEIGDLSDDECSDFTESISPR